MLRGSAVLVALLAAAGIVASLPGAAGADSSSDPSITCSLAITAGGQPVTGPIVQGTSVTLTATITDPSITPGAQPDITFWNGSAQIDNGGLPVVPTISGSTITASMTTSSIKEGGPWAITTQYEWGGNICISDPQQLTVTTPGLLKTDTTVTATPLGSSGLYSITATVTRELTGPNTFPSLSGTVYFYADGTQDPDYPNGVSLGANGVTTITWGGFPPGPHTIMASYSGDVYDDGSSGSVTLAIRDQPVLTYVGQATAGFGARAGLSAKLTDSDGNPLSGKPVTLTIHGTSDTCAGTTGQDGVAACTVTIHETPSGTPYTVDASFADDGVYFAASATGALTVGRGATTLAYLGDTSAGSGGTATLRAKLTDASGNPVTGATVAFALPEESCSGTTDGNGVAQCTVTVVETAGSAPTVSATFGGSTSYLPSSAGATLAVLRSATLTYDGSTTAVGGSTATVGFVLTDSVTGAPLENEPVSVTFDGSTYPLTTAADGSVSTTVTAPVTAQDYTVAASFGGDPAYGPAAGSGTLTVTAVPTTLAYTGDTLVVSGGLATLSARLTTAAGPVHDGELASFSLATGEHCSATTANGIATCTVRVFEPASSSDAVSVSFAGDGAYLASSASGSLSVARAKTQLVLTSLTPILRGTSTVLSAVLSSTEPGVLIPPGTSVVLGIGLQVCTGTTDASGAVSCRIPAVLGPTGYLPTTGVFLGSSGDEPALAVPGTVLVYALPSGGIFVVGDQTATGHVTFWGSRWATTNRLSGGAAPNAFKGFADTAPPQCGATWTSRPGASSSPPNAPLPAYMAVVVSSAIHKSGSAIGGDVKQVVIVRTDGDGDEDYDDAPGHVGTGTVVATLCG